MLVRTTRFVLSLFILHWCCFLYTDCNFVSHSLHLLLDMVYLDIFKRNIITIPKIPEHVCLTACVGLPGLPPSGPK
jgi:hypothetical protein